MTFSVYNQDGFAPVYTDDTIIEIRRGDLEALLNLATSSMDFGSGFWDNEEVEIARKVAEMLGVDPLLATPSNFTCQYKGEHVWGKPEVFTRYGGNKMVHYCYICRHVEDL